MTKEFCDYCNIEININNRDHRMMIRFTGTNKEEGFVSKGVTFCDNCYMNLNKKINTMIFEKPVIENR